MLSYDLVEEEKCDGYSVYQVWLDGFGPKSGGLNKNHQEKATGVYVGRIVNVSDQWVAIASFTEPGDLYDEFSLDADDLEVYQSYKTRKKAVNKLRDIFNSNLIANKA